MTERALRDRLVRSVDPLIAMLSPREKHALFEVMGTWEGLLLAWEEREPRFVEGVRAGRWSSTTALRRWARRLRVSPSLLASEAVVSPQLRPFVRLKLLEKDVLCDNAFLRRGEIWHELVPALESLYDGLTDCEIAAITAMTHVHANRGATLGFLALAWRQGRAQMLAALKDEVVLPWDELTEELLVIGAASVRHADAYIALLDGLSEGALLSILRERHPLKSGIDGAEVVAALCRKDLACHRFTAYHLNVATILLPWMQSGDDPLAPRVRELIDRWAQLVQTDVYEQLEAKVRLQCRERQPFDAKFVVWLCQATSDKLRALGREILADELILLCRTASRAP